MKHSGGLTDEEVGDVFPVQKIVKDLDPQKRKALKDELAKYPDPPGEEEFKSPYNGPDGEDLKK
jgi:hypothetical protein